MSEEYGPVTFTPDGLGNSLLHIYRTNNRQGSYFYQIKGEYQFTYESASGPDEGDYLNIITMSDEKYFYSQEPCSEHNRLFRGALQHYHDYYEFMIVLEGSVVLAVEGREYKYPAGSCCMINRGIRHCEGFDGAAKILFLGLSLDMAEELLRLGTPAGAEYRQQSAGEYRRQLSAGEYRRQPSAGEYRGQQSSAGEYRRQSSAGEYRGDANGRSGYPLRTSRIQNETFPDGEQHRFVINEEENVPDMGKTDRQTRAALEQKHPHTGGQERQNLSAQERKNLLSGPEGRMPQHVAGQGFSSTVPARFIAADIKNPGRSSYLDFLPAYSNAYHYARLSKMTEQLMTELLFPVFGSYYKVRGMLCDFLNYLADPENYHCTEVELGAGNDYLLFTRIGHLMEERDGRVSRTELEDLLNYSGDYLNRIVKKYSGMSLFDYGMTFCLKKAEYLLENSSDSVTEIAAQCGFTNKTHFYKWFRKLFGTTPMAYRQGKETKEDS